jgi:CRISPR-associated protein Cmr2
MRNLLLFTIGPVQSFISQARKTQDLYAGSKLLSVLIGEAIKFVGEENMIFPKYGKAMPNRFLAEVPSNENDLAQFGEKLEEKVRHEWKIIANNLISGMKKIPIGYHNQVDAFLEIYWSIEPVSENSTYKEIIEKLEDNIASLKNIRAFNQFTWEKDIIGEKGRKCSLDGQRNVLFYRPNNQNNFNIAASPLYSSHEAVYVDNRFPNNVILKPGEGLSAISFIKRGYKNNVTFESTADIALLDVLHNLSSLENETNLKYCIKTVRNTNAHLFYEENCDPKVAKNLLAETNTDKPLEEILDCSKKVREAAKKRGLKLSKYYAILTFDGDNMGKWLSGDYLENESLLEDFQRNFAECLSNFANDSEKYLDNEMGRTVYAGGDDFLGFVNLNSLLTVIEDLRKLFNELVNLPLNKFKNKYGETISFSAGICVAHYKEPLSIVLQQARLAQKIAKSKIKDKDSFSISVIKGSGESHTMVLPFGINAINVKYFRSICVSLIQEDYSNKFISSIRREFDKLLDTSDTIVNLGDFENIFMTELGRLLKRSAAKEPKLSLDNMKSYLGELVGDRPLQDFFQMLAIVDFFQRELSLEV